jgi:hypoxanthine phosphoribosyltransferase
MHKIFRCELVSWNQACRLSRKLANHIQQDNYKPDIVIAIARGGYVPARILCDILDIYNLASVRISHYTSGACKAEQARLTSPLCVDIKNLNVLVVDDVTDTGDTLQLALDHIQGLGPADIKIAVLHHKKVSHLAPDYYAKEIIKWRWITYPWALYEDITGFIEQMKEIPTTADMAREQLEEKYGIKVPAWLLEDIFSPGLQ